MRSNVVFGLLIAMLAAFGVAIGMRGKISHVAPEPVISDDAPSASASGTPAAAPSGSAAASAAASATGSAKPAGQPKVTLKRPLRVLGLGWELLAPGILANDGATPGKESKFSKKGLEVHLRGVKDVGRIEKALARGGTDEKGADVAILPLPQFVASYDRLKALNPVIFFVVGWSEGREIILSDKHKSLADLPPRGELTLGGNVGEAASFVGLFALDLAGIDLSRVRVVDKKKVTLAATESRPSKGGSKQRAENVLLNTAVASRLVPFVAIAQASLLDKHKAALSAWTRSWLDGHELVSADATAAARKIAETKGAPEPLTILARLGEVSSASLASNAQAAGLSGRGAVTLESLFQRTWQIWRDAKVLEAPPEQAPLTGAVIAELVRAEPGLVIPDAPGKAKGSDEGDKDKPLVVHTVAGKLEEAEVVSAIGFIAGVFRRSPVKITVHRGFGVDQKNTELMIDRAIERFGLERARLLEGKARPKGRAAATIEVMPIP